MLTRHGEQRYWERQGESSPISFEGLKTFSDYFYRVIRFGYPQKDQHYLSGALVRAWKAPNDLTIEYWIVEPTFRAKRTQSWVKGEKV